MDRKTPKPETDSLPDLEFTYQMNDAKIGLITQTASLKNIPGYVERMEIEVTRKRAENDEKMLARFAAEDAERSKPQQSTSIDNPSAASTPALVGDASPSAISAGPPTPYATHSPEVQSSKRKLDDITSSDNPSAENTKKVKMSAETTGTEQAENQLGNQRMISDFSVPSASSTNPVNASSSPAAEAHSSSPRNLLDEWQLDQMGQGSQDIWGIWDQTPLSDQEFLDELLHMSEHNWDEYKDQLTPNSALNADGDDNVF